MLPNLPAWVLIAVVLASGCTSYKDCSSIGRCNDNGKCECPFGVQGSSCEINRCGVSLKESTDPTLLDDPEANIPYTYCSSNGLCRRSASDTGSEFSCTCLSSFSGAICDVHVGQEDHKNCRTFNGSHETVCNERGICTTGGCRCLTGFSGPKCENIYCGAQADYNYIDEYDNPKWILCNAGGTCVETEEGEYQCQCRAHFTGVFCQEFNCINDSSCLNGGTCFFTTSPYISSTSHCKCLEGFSGLDCGLNSCGVEQDYQTGDIRLCSGSGVCIVGSKLENEMPIYQCECRVGHYGSACETFNCDISPNACNGGVCVIETTGDMVCKLCPKFFYGNDCAVNPCGIDNAGVACSGYGTCVEDGESAKCNCRPGRMGDVCSLRDCLTPGNECLNGGVCIDASNALQLGLLKQAEYDSISLLAHRKGRDSRSAGSTVCMCPKGYTGEFCTECDTMTELATQVFSNGTKVSVCAHESCFYNGLVCSNRGTCSYDESSDSFGCVCEAGYLLLGAQCWHPSCPIEVRGERNLPCGIGGQCLETSLGSDEWQCSCANTYRLDSSTGLCWPSACFGASSKSEKVCGGGGVCDLSTYTGTHVCNCKDGFKKSSDGITCVPSSSVIALAVIVPILLVLTVGGLCIYFLVCRRKRREPAKQASSKGTSYIRMNDGDAIRTIMGGGHQTL